MEIQQKPPIPLKPPSNDPPQASSNDIQMHKKRQELNEVYDELELSHFGIKFRHNIQEQIQAAYLLNFKPFEFQDQKGNFHSALLLYFINTNCDGADNDQDILQEAEQLRSYTQFKGIFLFNPYFYIIPASNLNKLQLQDLCEYLAIKFGDKVVSTQIEEKQDLDLPNHLSGKKRTVIKISFNVVSDLISVRNQIQIIVKRNKEIEELGQIGGHTGAPKVYADSARANQSNYASITHSSGHLYGTTTTSNTISSKSYNQQSNDNTMDSFIIQIREYDVPYHTRVAIDREIRVSRWYSMTLEGSQIIQMRCQTEMLKKPPLRVLAYDLETTKDPLKFPDPSRDQIMLVSYMIDGRGYLITNREIISVDIQNFEYSPTKQYKGVFTVFNVANERQLILKFISHIHLSKPHIYVTFNGDFFDWPFLDKRCLAHGIDLMKEIGITSQKQPPNGEIYTGRHAVHMDCFYWVQRDAYLPHGSHGLKAVTKAKLGYTPVEMDPEKMLPYAEERPQELCTYSASDAVATYYLYMNMIYDFIFALCTIIPSTPDEVLRKGSGTLCEELLMAQAFRGNIIFPNKKKSEFQKFHQGHLLDSQTYIGGKVESLRSGVYRSDLPITFTLDPNAYTELIDNVDMAKRTQQRKQKLLEEMKKIKTQGGCQDIEEINQRLKQMELQDEDEFEYLQDIVQNYDEVINGITTKLKNLRSRSPVLSCKPLIYHVDVAAMYPNIILSNRLQPVSIVNSQICASCCYNQDENNCKRYMQWQWRGQYFPLSRIEYQSIKRTMQNQKFQLQNTTFQQGRRKPGKKGWNNNKSSVLYNNKNKNTIKSFSYLPQQQRNYLIREKVKQYSQQLYRRIHTTTVQLKQDVVCMRENPFYVDTLRDFRDRRYEYKRLVKVWKKKKDEAENLSAESDAKNFINLYDSLQLAHKIILNSFYGYVMRKGARWYSMQMAAMVTHTGGSIIMDTKQLFDKIGMPLELDTDGIWTLLPSGFPENYKMKIRLFSDDQEEKENYEIKTVPFSYPCSLCNILVNDKYSNDQYQTLQPDGTYSMNHQMSVFFEIDGPYRCMFLPASREQGRLLKKRYAIFEDSGRISELKGFEIKRRGELQLIKMFQNEIFMYYLKGATLQQCYRQCGEIADEWFDILESQGEYISDEQLLSYIEEQRVLSKTIQQYGAAKSTAITCAKRLAEFLGQDIIKDKSLNTKYIIADKPAGKPVAARVIPTAIFQTDKQVKKKFLQQWLGQVKPNQLQIRRFLDWEYYKQRVRKMIQKLIIIPAALQGVMNPCKSPSLFPPPWLKKRKHAIISGGRQQGQTELGFYFQSKAFIQSQQGGIGDIQDLGGNVLMPQSAKKRALLMTPSLSKLKHTPRSGGRLEIIQDNEKQEFKVDRFQTPIKHTTSTPQRKVPPPPLNALQQITSKTSELFQKVPKITQTTFSNWLNSQKDIWKLIPQQIKSHKLHINTTSTTIGDYCRQNASAKLLQKVQNNAQYYTNFTYWHILEIRQVGLGTFKLFILPQNPSTGEIGSNYPLKISIKQKRTFYTNSKQKNAQQQQFLVQRSLPREKQPHNLYQLSMDQQLFHNNSDLFDTFLGDQLIEGVYQTQMPIIFRLFISLGCLIKPVVKKSLTSTIATKSKKQTKIDLFTRNTGGTDAAPDLTTYLFKSQEFNRISQLQAGRRNVYCPLQQFNKVYILQIQSGISRGVWLMYNQRSNQVHVFCVSSGNQKFGGRNNNNIGGVGGGGKLSMPNLIKAFRSTFQGKLGDDNNANLFSKMFNSEFHPYFIQSNQQATMVLDKILTEQCLPPNIQRELNKNSIPISTKSKMSAKKRKKLQEQEQNQVWRGDVPLKPSLIVLQSNYNTNELIDAPYNLKIFEFLPILRIPTKQSDAKTLPALDWERFATILLTSRLLDIVTYHIQQRLDLSRFAEIPICNLHQIDPHLQAIDLIVSRTLREQSHLLWYSDSPFPDLGHQLAIYKDYTSGVSTNPTRIRDLYEQIIQNPQVSNSGFYKCYVVQIDLEMLSVDAILFKKELQCLQNYIQPNFTNRKLLNIDQDYDEYGQTHPVFKIISQLMNSLYIYTLNQSNLSQNNIAPYQILQNIYRWISSKSSKLYDPWLHRVMNRVMRKIFARLLTRLQELGGKIVYASFYKIILSTNKYSYEEAKKNVEFMIESIGKYDIFQKLVIIPNAYWKLMLFKDKNNYSGISEGQGAKLVSQWNIAKHLPQAIQPEFHLIIADFIMMVFGQSQKLRGKKPRGLEEDIYTEILSTFEELDEKLVEFCKKYITKILSHRMFQLGKSMKPLKVNKNLVSTTTTQDNNRFSEMQSNFRLQKRPKKQALIKQYGQKNNFDQFVEFQDEEGVLYGQDLYQEDDIDDGYIGAGYGKGEIDRLHEELQKQLRDQANFENQYPEMKEQEDRKKKNKKKLKKKSLLDCKKQQDFVKIKKQEYLSRVVLDSDDDDDDEVEQLDTNNIRNTIKIQDEDDDDDDGLDEQKIKIQPKIQNQSLDQKGFDQRLIKHQSSANQIELISYKNNHSENSSSHNKILQKLEPKQQKSSMSNNIFAANSIKAVKMNDTFQEESLDDFIVDDDPNDIDNIQAKKQLAQILNIKDQSKALPKNTRNPYIPSPSRINALYSQIEQQPYQGKTKAPQWQFRQTVGSIVQNPSTPSIEFLNYICQILSLDQNLQPEVISLKQNCLFLLQASEIGSFAQYRDPSGSLVIPNVICLMCQGQTDLDLCHTDVLYERVIGQDGEMVNGKPLLVCNICGCQYNHDEIESMLLEVVARKIDGAQMQDLICKKCNSVKNTDFGKGCDVCGSIQGHHNTLAMNKHPNGAENLLGNNINLQLMLKVLKRVADQFRFEILLEYVDMLQYYSVVKA